MSCLLLLALPDYYKANSNMAAQRPQKAAKADKPKTTRHKPSEGVKKTEKKKADPKIDTDGTYCPRGGTRWTLNEVSALSPESKRYRRLLQNTYGRAEWLTATQRNYVWDARKANWPYKKIREEAHRTCIAMRLKMFHMIREEIAKGNYRGLPKLKDGEDGEDTDKNSKKLEALMAAANIASDELHAEEAGTAAAAAAAAASPAEEKKEVVLEDAKAAKLAEFRAQRDPTLLMLAEAADRMDYMPSKKGKAAVTAPSPFKKLPAFENTGFTPVNHNRMQLRKTAAVQEMAPANFDRMAIGNLIN